MTTKILCIGDPHFKVSNRGEMRAFVTESIGAIKKHAPDFVVVMGDVLDRHENIHVHALMDACQFLIDLSRLVKTYVLIGNHDRPNNSNFLTDEHPFTALKEYPNIVIVDTVVKEGEWCFVPYVPPGRFHEALETGGVTRDTITEYTCIFAHQEFKGSSYKNIVSTIGDVWPEDFPLVISGHIHTYQWPQDNIVYVGAPMQHNFGDPDDCSISLFTFSDESIDEERIYLNIPKKRVVRIQHDQVKEWLSKDDNFNGNTKLVITGPHDQLQLLSKSGVLKGAPENTKISLAADPIDTSVEQLPERDNSETISFKQVVYSLIEAESDSAQLQSTLNNILGITEPAKSAPITVKKKKIVFGHA